MNKMKTTTSLLHIGIQYYDKEKAELFFTKILNMPKTRSFTVSEELSKKIFGISKDVNVDVYSNNNTIFEVFITEKKSKQYYEHICIEIDNKDEFVKKCKKYGLKPNIIKKGEKNLLFVKDFANNLYEVKEKR